MTSAQTKVSGELRERLFVVVRVDPTREHETDGNLLRRVLRRHSSVLASHRRAFLEARLDEPLQF